MKYSEGSIWRKWDLHIHTPETAKNDQFGGDAWGKYVDTLEQNDDIFVLGITDYFSIENYLHLLDVQKAGRLLNKTLIPNVELRILPVTQKDTPINIHVLFNPSLSADVIEREFLQCIKFKYKGSEYSCLPKDLIALGRAYKGQDLDEKIAKKEGISQFNLSYNELHDVLKKDCLRNDIIVAVSNSSKDGNSGIQHSSLAATRQEIYRMSDIIFSGNENDIKYFLGEGKDNEETIIRNYGSLKPCITGSDAHSFDKINIFSNDAYTWIKADPTFEGLKQVLYEPKERVKIQKENPMYQYDKFPFAQIRILQETQVFADDQDIKFAVGNLTLNPNLVSIIGGRGTGKSQLINYLAAAFNENIQRGKYNLSSSIEISHAASLTEEAHFFKVSKRPNASFMYIAQSQIKDLVCDREKFSKNILETIGVSDEFRITSEYADKSKVIVDKYRRASQILNSNGISAQDRKNQIQREIKRYQDFITNITSERNKVKLEEYKKEVDKLNTINNWIENVSSFINKNDAFVQETNATLLAWNSTLKIEIPLVDITATQIYLKKNLLSKLEDFKKNATAKIEDTKNTFHEYKGDLATLLSNVSTFQSKVSDLNKELDKLKDVEEEYKTILTNSFKELGGSIVNDIETYTQLIAKKWKEFKGENYSISDEKKHALDTILQKGLEVHADISFDEEKMYNSLLSHLDGRSFSEDKLRNIIKIQSIENFIHFIKQDTTKGAFDNEIREDLRIEILNLFYLHYTDFIHIGVKVTLDNKPLTKLSFGQQGTVYLRLQLAANLYSETIIYDQPEDDLDNDFISNELIPIFKIIKKFRQVIIVSHNANLVVNADSEQIIIANNNEGILSYTSGSLENPEINKEVCRILEGGEKAFEDREKKYSIQERKNI